MKKIIAASALIAGLSFAVPAFAQSDESFTGPTVTAIAGFDSVKFKVANDSESKSGFAYGGALGYDYDLGVAVIGAEAEIDGSTTRESFGGLRLKAGRDLYVGARAGFKVSPNTLLYVKAGYTNAKIKAEVAGFSDSSNIDGYRLGAGAELKYGKTFGRLEYRFSDYGEFDNTGVKISRHQVVAGIGYRF